MCIYNLVPSNISSCENALTELLECHSDPKFTAKIRSKYVKKELGISLKRKLHPIVLKWNCQEMFPKRFMSVFESFSFAEQCYHR